MKRHWNVQELREHWSLSVEERFLLAHKAPRSQLGFAVLLKFFQLESRFPRDRREVPQTAVQDLAQQLDVSPAQFDAYDWHGRTGKAQRSAIRAWLGFRRTTEADATHLLAWLRREMLPQDPDEAHVQDYALSWYRERRIEPPTSASLRRSIRAALHGYETDFYATMQAKLPPATQHALDALLDPAPAPATEERTPEHADAEPIPFNVLKADPGRVGVASVLKEAAKLRTLTALQLPKDLFATVSRRSWRRTASGRRRPPRASCAVIQTRHASPCWRHSAGNAAKRLSTGWSSSCYKWCIALPYGRNKSRQNFVGRCPVGTRQNHTAL
jgi:hypothetical protein